MPITTNANIIDHNTNVTTDNPETMITSDKGSQSPGMNDSFQSNPNLNINKSSNPKGSDSGLTGSSALSSQPAHPPKKPNIVEVVVGMAFTKAGSDIATFGSVLTLVSAGGIAVPEPTTTIAGFVGAGAGVATMAFGTGVGLFGAALVSDGLN